MYKYDIGVRIKYYRTQLGMTQEELAHKLGYKSKSTIQKIEKGINDIPQSKILPFSNALNISPIDLLGSEQLVIEHVDIPNAHNGFDFPFEKLNTTDALQLALSKDKIIGDYKFSDEQLLYILRFARSLTQEE